MLSLTLLEDAPMRWQSLLSSVASAVIIVAAATPAHAQAKPPTKAAAKPASEVKKTEQAATKTAKAAEKTAEHAEHRAFARAEAEPEQLLKGTKLTKSERTQVNTIERKYRKELSDLRKSHEAAEKAGKEDDSQIVARVDAITDRERAELRGVLTAAQQTTFDKNVGKLKK
jgi:Ni/Co efflux regulator RcnB